ncbi:hypothetical protein CEXT_672121 [Caerostris extrusa]|uniref:Uncharacterized protein n=1 Tax=Caerostris extrusa TaxID=172846 RepID=A0AAV4RM12_CAEEX|nr:hypothetical protein CEXT_672121 [Caerostris extrusa]
MLDAVTVAVESTWVVTITLVDSSLDLITRRLHMLPLNSGEITKSSLCKFLRHDFRPPEDLLRARAFVYAVHAHNTSSGGRSYTPGPCANSL